MSDFQPVSEHVSHLKTFTRPFVRREQFDPTNQAHLLSYQRFLVTGTWGDVLFFAEHPFHTAPDTVHHRFALHQLEALIGPFVPPAAPKEPEESQS